MTMSNRDPHGGGKDVAPGKKPPELTFMHDSFSIMLELQLIELNFQYISAKTAFAILVWSIIYKSPSLKHAVNLQSTFL